MVDQRAKYIFLDVDGVLNSQEFWHRHVAAGGRGGMDGIDVLAMQRLNALVATSGARVVLSSYWRFYGLEAMRELFRQKGAGFCLSGVTPDLKGRPRGHEIRHFLIDHTPVDGVCLVILDDNDDMDHLADRLIQTDHRVGLTDADCARALAMLTGREGIDG